MGKFDRNELHRLYGGEIELADFNTYEPNKRRINNQAEADKLIEQLKSSDNKVQIIERLKELRLISNSNGTPPSIMTDEKWQKEFEIRKLLIKPYPKNIKKLSGLYSRESGKIKDPYYGTTNWQQYCSFINDVLRNIRNSHVDYCYYIYQIEDLLKFHHDTLRTKYCDEYWEVWLDR